MTGAPGETLAFALLAVALVVAIRWPGRYNEAAGAVPGAALLVLCGTVSVSALSNVVGQLAPTVTFLALILMFGRLCADENVFDYLGALTARASGGRPSRLLALVVALAAGITAVLTLDATVVLATPVVIHTARRLRIRARPHVYACQQLANAGSLLLPVSNLTNLLAFKASGVSFGRFAGLMLLPWLCVCALEWLALRAFFRADLTETAAAADPPPPAPRYPLVILALTVAGFVLTSSLDIAPAWAAGAGCLALGVPRLARRQATPSRLLASANIGFCVFVLALGVIVEGVRRHGLSSLLARLMPAGDSLLVLLAVATIAAVLANLVNNLPATLMLVPLAAGSPVAVLAVLLGVNIGPNLTYAGSLATLLWRRVLPADEQPNAREFHLLGALTVPVLLATATVALWAANLVI